MPVLPPTDESTCASRLVGTWMKSRPRRTLAAAKPARSPTTPPPSATTRSPRSILAAISASQTRSNVAMLFEPGEHAAADDDVIGARAERDVDDDGLTSLHFKIARLDSHGAPSPAGGG